MSKIFSNKYRTIYVFLIIITIAIAWYSYPWIANNPEKYLLFSYIASVTTILALLISLFEIIHNISISLSIKKEAFIQIKPKLIPLYDRAIELIDDIQKKILQPNISLALMELSNFRKMYFYIKDDLESNSILPLCDEINLELIKIAMNGKKLITENNEKITEVFNKLVKIKTEVENSKAKLNETIL